MSDQKVWAHGRDCDCQLCKDKIKNSDPNFIIVRPGPGDDWHDNITLPNVGKTIDIEDQNGNAYSIFNMTAELDEEK